MRPEVKPISLDVFNRVVQDVEQKTGEKFCTTRGREKSLENINRARILCGYSKLIFQVNESEENKIFIRAEDQYEGLDVMIGDIGSATLFKSYTL